jgi:polar amino acid transport system substrate-binding protein
MPTMKFSRFIYLLVLFIGADAAMGEPKVTFNFEDRPPFLVQDKGALVGGLAGKPVLAAFEGAGIPLEWSFVPFKRQIYNIQGNVGQHCMVAFKTHEREAFAKFTLPIFRDGATVVLTRSDNDGLSKNETLRGVFGKRLQILIAKDGRSNGNVIDALIGELRPITTLVSADNSALLKMILLKRGDYMLVAPEEVEGMIKAAGLSQSDFKVVTLTDAPPGETRHIMCSKTMPDELINKLNLVIEKMKKS